MAFFENKRAPSVKMAFNVNAFIDHQNGVWVRGSRGESILVGGFTHNTGILAMNNTGKSELLLEIITKVAYRYEGSKTLLHDTEGTMDVSRPNNYYNRWDDSGFEMFNLDDPDWPNEMVGPSLYIDEWFNQMLGVKKERMKMRGVKKHQVTLPFEYRGKDCSTIPPLVLAADSYSEAASSVAEEKIEAKGVIDKSNQTFDMIVGNLKTRIMHGMTSFPTEGEMYFISTAVLDKFVDVTAVPGRPQGKHTAHIAADKKPKGVGSKYKGLTSATFTFGIPAPLWKGTGKADRIPKYPASESELYPGNKMYEHTEMINARGKSSSSGFVASIVKQQGVGFRADLSELLFIREWGDDNVKLKDLFKDYGIESHPGYQFSFAFLPDLKWRNTTLQACLKADPKVHRAIEILFGMKYEIYVAAHPEFMELACTPEELYKDLKEMGYDWDVLLDTRGWWCYLESEKKHKPFLSTLDLLRMRAGKYIPFWFTKEQKAAIKTK